MRIVNHVRLAELHKHRDFALADWQMGKWVHPEPEPGKPPWTAQRPYQEPGNCKRCCNTTPATAPASATFNPCSLPMGNHYCPICYPQIEQFKDEMHERERMRDQRKHRSFQLRRYRDERRQSYTQDIAPRYRNCWFRNFSPPSELIADISSQIQKWVSSEEAQARFPFLFVHGAPGVGKTHLAIAAARKFGRTVAVPTFYSEAKFVDLWQRGFEAHGTKRRDSDGDIIAPTVSRPSDLVDRACESRLLIWDDMGKAKPTDAWARVIFQIIDCRWEQMLPTLITSNFGVAELPGRVGESTADRATSGLVLTMEGMSMRGAA